MYVNWATRKYMQFFLSKKIKYVCGIVNNHDIMQELSWFPYHKKEKSYKINVFVVYMKYKYMFKILYGYIDGKQKVL